MRVSRFHSMLKILQITNYYYPHIGGIEQVTRDVVRALNHYLKDQATQFHQKNPQPDCVQKVICFNETASDGSIACKREETVVQVFEGIEIYRCGCITKKFSQSISLTFPKILKAVLTEFQPDIVIFHYPNPFQAFFLVPYLKENNFKFILYWHLDITKQKVLRRIFENQTNYLLKQADKIIATSPTYIDGSSYLNAYRYKCNIIPNCINEDRLRVTEDITNIAKQIRKKNQGKVICFAVGRHIPYKGFSYLIEASKYLDNRFRIIIGGSGEMTNTLKAQASGDSKISFTGRLTDKDLIAHYLAMDIFCFPSISKNEAFGIALAEAMYFSKPAVTFRIPGSGVNYVNLDGKTGIEVENGNIKAYADALNLLANNHEQRLVLGNQARQRVIQFFTSSQFDKNIQEIIAEQVHRK